VTDTVDNNEKTFLTHFPLLNSFHYKQLFEEMQNEKHVKMGKIHYNFENVSRRGFLKTVNKTFISQGFSSFF
jgi:hypothetical protein